MDQPQCSFPMRNQNQVNNKVCVTVLIGPPKCGKTTFAREVQRYFGSQHRDYFVDIFLRNENMPIEELAYHLKCYLSHLLSPCAPDYLVNKNKLILIDTNMCFPAHRFEVYRICYLFNVSYAQVYLQFNMGEIVARNREQVFRNILPDNIFWFLISVSCPRNCYEYWETNIIVIFSTFTRDRGYELRRFYNFIQNCNPQFRSDFLAAPRIIYHNCSSGNNAHEMQIQSGVLYRDKLLRGPAKKPKDPSNNSKKT